MTLRRLKQSPFASAFAFPETWTSRLAIIRMLTAAITGSGIADPIGLCPLVAGFYPCHARYLPSCVWRPRAPALAK